MRSMPNTIALAQYSVATATADAATVTINPAADEYVAIDWIAASYQGTAITGNLQVSLGGTVILNFDIDGATYVDRFLPFHIPLSDNTLDSTAIVTLASGGTGVAGKLTVGYR